MYFLLITAAVYVAGIVLLSRGLQAWVMFRLRGPFRRFGIERARDLVRQQQDTGETPPELEPILAEVREMGCGGNNQFRYPPKWVLQFAPLAVALTVAWLLVFA